MIAFIHHHRIYGGIAALAAMLFFSCTNELEKIRFDETEDIPVAITKDVILLYSDSARLVSRIQAPLRNDYLGNHPRSEFPEGITISFFDSNQKPQIQLRADFGIIWQHSGTLNFYGHVELKNKNGSVLKTEELTWDNKLKKIYTQRPIEILDEGRMLTGQGLVAHENFEEYIILIPTGTFSIKE
ncbi:MAG: LPS export ABC transporter periplasmic protein LptC [Flavobacteriales bacterium]|nr:LPS export ABC transporter periplasmic protein LptC [Flavobacteriales bacterium]